MTLTLQLPPHVERQLRTRASDCGLELSEFVVETLLCATEKPAEMGEVTTDLREEDSPWRGVFTVSPTRGELAGAISVGWADPSSPRKPEIVLDPTRLYDESD